MTRRILLLALLLAGPATAAEPPRLLILPFDNVTGQSRYDPLQDGVPDLLTACFSQYHDHVQVVDRAFLTRLAAEQSLAREGVTEPGSGTAAGRLSGADFLLRGSIGRGSRGFEIKAFLHDIATTRLVAASEAGAEASSLGEALCRDLAGTLAAALRAGAPAPLDLAPEAAPEASRWLVLGMGHFFNGHYAQAIPAFMKLQRRDPQDAQAQFWLARSFFAAGLTDFAEIELKRFLDKFPEDSRQEQVTTMLAQIRGNHDE